MKKMRDLGHSLFREVGSDSAESFYDHLSILGRIALDEFLRNGRGVPRGLFEDAGLRFSGRMLDIEHGHGKTIVIMPMGNVPVDVIRFVSQVAWEIFGVPVRILRARTIWPAAYDPKSMRAFADEILFRALLHAGEGRIIVLTDLELYLPRESLSVWGYGQMTDTVCVASTFGLGVAQHGLHHGWARFAKVVIHELGHTYGLRHHPTERKDVPCVMNMVPGSDERPGLDFLTHELCSVCLRDVMTGKNQFRDGQGAEKPCLVRF